MHSFNDLFSLSPDIHKVAPLTSERVFKYLDELLSENKRIETSDLLEFIAEKENVPHHLLGIRLCSIGLAISALKSAKQNGRMNIHAANICRKRIKEVWEEELSRIQTILSTDPQRVQIGRYAKMTAWQFLTDVGFSCRTLVDNDRDYEKIEELIDLLKRNHNLSRIFHLAVCQGRFVKKTEVTCCTSEEKVLAFCVGIGVRYGDCDELMNAEKRVLNHFGVKNFNDIMPGTSFLQFTKRHFSRKASIGCVRSEAILIEPEDRRCDVSREGTIERLKECRPMSSIDDNLNWSAEFEHRLGDLRSFLAGLNEPDLIILEVSGKLVMLTNHQYGIEEASDDNEFMGRLIVDLINDRTSLDTLIFNSVVSYLRKSKNPTETVVNCLRLLRISPICFEIMSDKVFARALSRVCPKLDARAEIERISSKDCSMKMLPIIEEVKKEEQVNKIGYSLRDRKPKRPRIISKVKADGCPMEHIERIRSKFSGGTNELCEMIGRSVRCLALDLYNSDSHFAHELIQNADDCEYDEDVEATIEFDLNSADRVISVHYNEKGFKNTDIDAICDIGNSSKTGLIGRKGIGFRSVFKVTDAPEIHSNGYHIKFDVVKNGPLGYVMPEWTENRSNEGTLLLLPMKDGVNPELEGIDARLLLFLRNITSIVVKDDNGTFEAIKEVSTDGRIIKLTEKFGFETTIEEWLVVRGLSQDGLEASIAFPLFLDHTDCDVYAFLPVKSYNLPFVIHADFEVTASRQDINFSSERNASLLDTLVSLFVDGIINDLKDVVGHDKAYLYLCKHIPNPNVVPSVSLKSFASACVKGLSQAQIFPSNNSLLPPAQCAYFRLPPLRRLIDDELVFEKFHKFLLDEKRSVFDFNVYKLLGVKEMTLEDLVDVLAYDEKHFWRYLLAINRGLSLLSIEEEIRIIRLLHDAKVFPVHLNGSKMLVKLSERAVYLPFDSNPGFNSILDNFALLSRKVFDCDDKEEIECFLGRLGVDRLSWEIVIRNTIIRLCSRDHCDYVKCLVGVFEQWRLNKARFSELLIENRGDIYVKTILNGYLPVSNVIMHDRNVERLFPFARIDQISLESYCVSNESDFSEFLKLIGICGLVRIVGKQDGDFYCPEFKIMASMGIEACETILEYMSSNWDELKNYTTIQNQLSSFGKSIKTWSWIPCVLNGELATSEPSNVFIRNVQIERLFGDNIHYLKASFDPPREMTRFLGITDKIDDCVLKRMIHEWYNEGLDEAVPINIAHLFSTVFRTFAPDQVLSEFPLIWLHSNMENVVGSEDKVKGGFVHYSKLNWSPNGLELLYPAKMAHSFISIYGFDCPSVVDAQPERVLALVDSMTRKRNHQATSECQPSRKSRPSPDAILPGLVKRMKCASPSTRETGRWGEEYVFFYLKESKKLFSQSGA